MSIIIRHSVFIGMWMLCVINLGHGQVKTHDSKRWADDLMARLVTVPGTDNESGLALTDSAFNIYKAEKDLCGMLKSRMLSGRYFDGMGRPDSSIARLLWARDRFNPQCDSILLFQIYVNLTGAYLTMGDYNQVDSLCTRVLLSWNHKWKEHGVRFGLLTNKAIAQASNGFIDEAQQTFQIILKDARIVNSVEQIDDALINLGTIKQMVGDLDSAYYYFNQALVSAVNRNDYHSIAAVKFNIAVVLGYQKRYDEALVLLSEIEHDAYVHSDLQSRADVERTRADLYKNKGDYKNSILHFENFLLLRDSVLSEERIRSVADMQEKYETEKKKREIQDLKVTNLNSALETERAKRTRNYLYAGAGLLAIALFSLVQRYRIVNRNRKLLREKNIIIETEKQHSDNLLKNILPDEVAEELKKFGKAKAQQFDEVSILFTDFKGFTMLSEKLTAQELVAELDTCFQAFDHIITQYHLEKIKTIGDAYMATGGLPLNQTHNAQNVVEAALDMQAFITERLHQRNEVGLPAFEMRVGIHSGPVVAGVVGVKKFQYDVWGDTVNTASRMESSGQEGEVNISETTYELVRHVPHFIFETRGKIKAKNKGEMNMYFVRRKNTHSIISANGF